MFTVDNPRQFNWDGDADFIPLDKKIERDRQGSSTYMYLFELGLSHARHLFTLLSRERVTAARFFPGYDGVVKALRERQWRTLPGQGGLSDAPR